MRDGQESDVDCGGSCDGCADGKGCGGDADCKSGRCANGACQPATGCQNGQKDGSETDMDCGGAQCPACGDGRICLMPSDCTSNNCSGGFCAPPLDGCHDNITNNDETDVDCGGKACPPCVEGKTCMAPSDCATMSCVGDKCGKAALTLSFGPRQIYAGALYQVLLRDYDGDKNLDIAGISKMGQLAVYLGKGDGTFSQVAFYPLNMNDAMALSGDFNGDGCADIVTGGQQSPLTVFLGNKDHTLHSADPVNAGPRVVPAVVGDVNGDQRADIVGWSLDWMEMALWKGRADGTFDKGPTFANDVYPFAGDVGDMNHDGRRDFVLLGGQQPVSFYVYLADGLGGFKAPVTTPVVSPYWATFADVNGDKSPDAIYRSSNVTSLSLGRGDGTFGPGSALGAGNNHIQPLVADLDLDGKLDVLDILGGGDIKAFLGDGKGGFREQAAIPTQTSPQLGALGDLNGDGKPDLVVAVSNGGGVAVMLNTSK